MQQAETTLSRITMVLGPVVLDLKAPPRIRDGSLGERRNDVVRHLLPSAESSFEIDPVVRRDNRR